MQGGQDRVRQAAFGQDGSEEGEKWWRWTERGNQKAKHCLGFKDHIGAH